MKTIQKVINLENYRSRLPGVIDSFWGSIYYDFNTDSGDNLHGDENETVIPINIKEITESNYALIPNNIKIPENDDYGILSVSVLSYPSVVEIYHFFQKYNKILNTHTCKGEDCSFCKSYSSATEYFVHEGSNTYPKEYYEELDEIYKRYGGDKLYEYLDNNIVVKFDIPSEYRDKWGCDFLYHTEVLKWSGWLKERSDRYGDSECKDTDDCCDCQEFKDRGGKDILEQMKKFINDLSFVGNEVDTYEDIVASGGTDFTNIACINVPICVTNSIDDLGEFTIFSEEWEGGKEFSQGTVINYGGDSYYVSGDTAPSITLNEKVFSSGLGTRLNEYKEFLLDYGENDSVLGKYFDELKKEDSFKELERSGNITAYTYNNKGELIVNPTPNNMYESHKLKCGLCFVANDKVYKVKKELCIKITNPNSPLYNLSFVVEKDLNGLFVKIGNKVIRSTVKDGKEIFYLTKYGCVEDNAVEPKEMYCVTVGKKTHILAEVDNDKENQEDDLVKSNTIKININNLDYDLLRGFYQFNNRMYFVTVKNDGWYLVIEEPKSGGFTYVDDIIHFGKRVNSDDATNDEKCYTIKNGILIIYNPYKEYPIDVVSGYTSSQLKQFVLGNELHDNQGNKLPGSLMIEDGKEVVPKASNVNEYLLDLPFKIGETTHLSALLDGNDVQQRNGNTTYWWGNMLTKISFYYTDAFGEKIIELPPIMINDKWKGLKTYISELDKKKDKFLDGLKDDYNERVAFTINHGFIDENIRCDIEYVIGYAISKLRNENETKMDVVDETDAEHFVNGVKYNETLTLIPDFCKYYLNDEDYLLLNYYELNPSSATVITNEYLNETTDDNLAHFTVLNNLFDKDLNSRFNKFPNMVADDDFSYHPVFRDEFRVGISSRENVEGDIYINRGTAQCFDNHLKIMEVKTLEALEQYGNGYFNIKQNK